MIVIATTEAEDAALAVTQGTDHSKYYVYLTNSVARLIAVETRVRTTDRLSSAREFALAVDAGDTSDATAQKEIQDAVLRAEAEKDTSETDTTTDATKTRAADLRRATTREGKESTSAQLADGETTRVRQGETPVRLWDLEDSTGT